MLLTTEPSLEPRLLPLFSALWKRKGGLPQGFSYTQLETTRPGKMISSLLPVMRLSGWGHVGYVMRGDESGGRQVEDVCLSVCLSI